MIIPSLSPILSISISKKESDNSNTESNNSDSKNCNFKRKKIKPIKNTTKIQKKEPILLP